ncbi:hypothetical protein B0T26DRAFT_785265 [Lasiosphaeria miniovina]|uniref:Short-chain dehydrogenase/reductase family protein n=1 Tax=Lasiosphaeria miniovina TaxID=1954250 RepID=A0AA40A4S9_9PEZI|nr:uncharacterized protein B0T26DRAFT_785265 [Lasiosphaeria miniovina]KAK0709328.1 hypothetical protein B0T26DRAFT_785265 [Lasiosphaeria miniovina]
MVGSKDLPPSTTPFFPNVFFRNQFRAKPQWPAPGTSLSGQTAIVTGANTGLGYEAAAQLLGLQLSRLVVAVRSLERGEAAAAKLRQLHPKATVDVWELDMSSYASVQAFARRADAQLQRIDMVILNAGLVRLAFHKIEATGHEETMQVNYLSTVLLAVLLLPILKAKGSPNGPPPRLSIVNAALSLAAKFPNRAANPLLPSFDDPAAFDAREHYHSSKLLAHMFLWQLADRVAPADVVVNLADPAWCKGTDLGRDVQSAPMRAAAKLFGAATGRPKAVGASCLVDAVVNKGQESHGCFLMSWQIHPFSAFLYTPEGAVVIQRVWDETLAELDFAGVRGILESMGA